jgi:Methylamine utilisation protein MauE
MTAALAPPFVVAALVLCVAGVMKLRSSSRPMAALGVGEMALGVACVVNPTRPLAVALTVLFASFAAVAAVLRRRRLACRCFGENHFPVSLAHVIASELLGMLAAAAAVAGPRGLGWVVAHPAPQAVALLVGIAGAVYAVVLVYTVVPRAWTAWSLG